MEKAKLLRACGGIAVLLGLVASQGPRLLRHVDFAGWGFSTVAVIATLAIVLIALGTRWIHRGTQLVAPSGTDLAHTDSRDPVVYFRPFTADAALAGVPRSTLTTSVVTIEEQLAGVLSEVGPVVAIGRPGEALPTLGAARTYTSDEHWQPEVRSLLSRCRLAVL
jgi:hypothetical protein